MADSMVVFWGSGSPPCWRVMIALEEKLLSGYQRRLLSFEKQQHKSKEVLAINPRGQLPTFRHGDVVLNESYGVCIYLENQFKSQGAELIPSCPTEQAGVLQRMFEVQTLQEKMGIVIYYKWRVPENEQHDTAVERNKKALSVELKLWEGYMEKASPEPYIMGKNFTMADVMLFPQLAYGVRFALSQEKYPKLLEYYHRLEKRPSIQASWPPHWKESAPTSDILKDI
ncbi:glutathione S-transferase rho [Callorhinchus milii]|uniref:Glutathione S-transferase A n=1 Tax=Callorhinchus milii TaxID=7868 RepID=V9KE02_CALMI|nr:glutathione S-transferase rho [Callorhinchus milii]|eukprot:gi/632975113/ref/XP_007904045.1/ PREDICTED: glutathione S-transferase A-like [Callorhinchus milii]